MNVEYIWSQKYTTQELYVLESEFETSIEPLWSELIESIKQNISLPVNSEDEMCKLESYFNYLRSVDKIYMFKINKDEIYIEPYRRFYGKIIKITE